MTSPKLPKERRALADGPAFREAMAELENESSGGWKILDGPAAKPKPTAISGERVAVTPKQPAVAPELKNTMPLAPRAPRPDQNRTQVLPPRAPVRKTAVLPPVAPKPPEVTGDAFASTMMAVLAETAPRARQESAPVVLSDPAPVSEPPTVPVPAAMLEPATVRVPAVVVEPAPTVVPPPVVFAEPAVPEPPAVVAPPPPLQEVLEPSFAVSAERVGAPSALMPMPVEPAWTPPAPRRSSRRQWVVGLVAGGVLVVGLLAGIGTLGVLMKARTAQQAPAPHPKAAPAPAPAPAPPTVVDSAAALPAPTPSSTMGEAPSREAPGAAPWSDQPETSSTPCAELAAAAPASSSVDGAIKDALRSMMRGDAKAAHEAFCVATERGARNQTVLMGQAHVLLIQSDYAAALQVVDRELKLRPSPAARILRGDVLIRTGKVADAKQEWLLAAGVPHDSEPLVQNLRRGYKAEAQAAIRAGDLARADRTLRRVIALGPPDRASCLQLADTLDKRGHSAAAERWRTYAGSLRD